VTSGRCPAQDDIKPCTCSEQLIKCYATHEFDLDQVFKAISIGKSEYELSFDTFELSSTKIMKLEDSVFQGIKFKTFKFVSCDQLSCVSPMTFAGMEKSVEKFISTGSSFRWDVSHSEDCNIFKALRHLTSLREVNITGSKINEIPAEAFHDFVSKQSNLVTIDLSQGEGGDINKIGKNAFASLQGLKYLDLSSHKINTIDSYGFSFSMASNEKLIINLEHNNITYKSFANNSLLLNGRTTTLKLGANPLLQVLDESVFHEFLISKLSGDQNQIDLRGSPLYCNSKNLWLLELKSELKLQQKITNALSPDGLDFWTHTKSQCSADLDKLKPV